MKDENNMTIQNAIQEIDRLAYAAMQEYNVNREEDAHDEEVLSVAVWAMSKQIPMKPNKYRTEGDFSQDLYGCEVCNGCVGYLRDYCPYCGQKIDWTED